VLRQREFYEPVGQDYETEPMVVSI